MTKLKKVKGGFTLIELMIVVAIIGILAAVAIPKFADLVTKSKEASIKGSLGAVRSALSIYYGDMEGIYPSNIFSLALAARYMPQVAGADALGTVDIPVHSAAGGNPGHSYGPVTAVDVTNTSPTAPRNIDAKAFDYGTDGTLYIGCTHNDTKGSVWNSY